MGNKDFSDFNSLFNVYPHETYDSLVHNYIYHTDTDISQIIQTPWTERAIYGNSYNTNAIPKAMSNPLKT